MCKKKKFIVKIVKLNVSVGHRSILEAALLLPAAMLSVFITLAIRVAGPRKRKAEKRDRKVKTFTHQSTYGTCFC